jgi:uncharacterized membrane protein
MRYVMVNNLYPVLVVVFRVAGLYLCLSALFGGLAINAIGVGRVPMQASMGGMLFLSFGLGIVLWLLSKRAARLITKDLDEK